MEGQEGRKRLGAQKARGGGELRQTHLRGRGRLPREAPGAGTAAGRAGLSRRGAGRERGPGARPAQGEAAAGGASDPAARAAPKPGAKVGGTNEDRSWAWPAGVGVAALGGVPRRRGSAAGRPEGGWAGRQDGR